MESVTKGAEQPDTNKGNERVKDEVEMTNIWRF